MDRSTAVGVGVTVLFVALQYLVMQVPPTISAGGTCIGLGIVVWGLLPEKLHLKPGAHALFTCAGALIAAGVAWQAIGTPKQAGTGRETPKSNATPAAFGSQKVRSLPPPFLKHEARMKQVASNTPTASLSMTVHRHVPTNTEVASAQSAGSDTTAPPTQRAEAPQSSNAAPLTQPASDAQPHGTHITITNSHLDHNKTGVKSCGDADIKFDRTDITNSEVAVDTMPNC
jgi:hypothetical protein